MRHAPLPLPDLALAAPIDVDLSNLSAPSLAELEGTITPFEPSPEKLLVRFYAATPKRKRAGGEPVGPNDVVQINQLGYSNRQLVPHSIRWAQWLTGADRHYPGLREALNGVVVGKPTVFRLKLPANPRWPEWSERIAVFRIEVLAAEEPTVKNGPTEEVLAGLSEEAREEALQLAISDAQQQVLRTLAGRVAAPISTAHIDREIRFRWAEREGAELARRLFSIEEQQEALQLWLSDPDERASATHRLRVSLALEVLRRHYPITLDKSSVTELIGSMAKTSQLDPDVIRARLKKDSKAAERFARLALHVASMEFVMKHATFRWCTGEVIKREQ